MCFFLAPTVPENERIALSQRLAPFASHPVRCLIAAMFFCGAGDLMFYNYLGVIVLEAFGTTQKMVVLSLLLVGLTGCLAIFSAGVLIDWVGVRMARLSIVGGSSIALIFLGIHMASIASLDITFLVLLSAWSVFSWGFSTAMQASLIQVGGEQAMLAMALSASAVFTEAARPVPQSVDF